MVAAMFFSMVAMIFYVIYESVYSEEKELKVKREEQENSSD